MITDTNGSIFPQGTFKFRVSDIPKEIDVKGYVAWEWAFEAETDNGLQTYKERFMVWLLAPLLRALEFHEIQPGKFEWEPTMALGGVVEASIVHVVLDKGASAGKTVARMQFIKPASAAVAAKAPVNKTDDILF